MSENTNLHEIIAFFGDIKLNANPDFKKYREHCPFDPYGTILEYTYRARLSDITSDLDEVKQTFKEANRQFHNDIFVIVELGFMKEKTGRVDISISAFPYVAFRDSDKPQYIKYCGDKDSPVGVMTENVNDAEKYLEDMLTPENIVKAIAKALK